MGHVLLVRHGQAGFGRTNYDQLSDRGHAQARLTGTAWRNRTAFAMAVSGGMRRHRETAAGFAETYVTLPPLQVDPGFDEYAHEAVLRAYRPDLAGRGAIAAWLANEADPRAAFRAAFEAAVRSWIEHGDAPAAGDVAVPESFPAFQRRTFAALERLRATAANEGSVVVFTSGGVISALTLTALGLPSSGFFDLSVELVNAAVTGLRPTEAGWRLTTFNAHLHLLGHTPSLLTRL